MPIVVQSDSGLGIRQRIFQLFCLIAGVFATFIAAPVNLLEHMPLQLSAGAFLAGLAFLGMLYIARMRGVYLFKLSALLMLATLNLAWFFNGGSQGPTSLICFLATILFTLTFDGTVRWMFLTFFILDQLAL